MRKKHKEKVIGKENQKRAKAKIEKIFSVFSIMYTKVLQQKTPPFRQLLLSLTQSNLHLSYLSYSVPWSKRLIRRKFPPKV